MTHYLSTEDAVWIFRENIGPHPFILDGERKLDGAMKAPTATFDGELYPTVFLKGAVLMREVAIAHAFEDGNKRLAWYLVDGFLQVNGYVFGGVPDDEVDAVVRSACETEGITVDGIAAWLQQNSLQSP